MSVMHSVAKVLLGNFLGQLDRLAVIKSGTNTIQINITFVKPFSENKPPYIKAKPDDRGKMEVGIDSV